ncbi:MAG: hypothetical protein K2H75_09100 [Muribaculaceae bacterium]|nr:hypothetical protein [Muribaculaceae bacterium]
MVNKREFKKFVDAVGSSVCEEMMTAYHTVEGADRDAISKAIEQVLGAIGAAKSNANIFFDKGAKAFDNPKEYARAKEKFFRALFNKITNDFNHEVNSALKTFNAALPESAKADNKAAVAAQ